METTKPTVVLVVTRGPNTNARLAVDERVRTIGRSRESDLALTDLSVSRHHLQVTAHGGALRFVLCSGAAPVVIGGRPAERGEARAGDTILVGSTTLSVRAMPDASPDDDAGPVSTDVRTLLTGAAADVTGLAAIFELSQILDTATDRPGLEGALTTWARAHVQAGAVGFVMEGEGPEAARLALKPNDVSERTLPGTATTEITVPSHGSALAWLVFTVPAARAGDAMRRLLLLAGRLFASSWVRLRESQVRDESNEPLRRLAIGSARAFVGSSSAIEPLGKWIPKLAASDVTAVVVGETGVGKTFVARLIHESGARRGEPLRILNCAAIPENLIESELFGHERGAFTGAVAARPGALEAAGRGTVLLDEIGELPLASQSKLLRVIEEKRFERLGSNRPIALHARVLAATNRDLDAMVAAGSFRSDLYFRISVVIVRVPPLRERGDDVVTLARQVLSDLGESAGRRIDGFSPAALEAIRQYPWPGNVRELRNIIERAVVLGDSPMIALEDLPAVVVAARRGARSSPDSDTVKLPVPLDELEKRNVECALRVAGGNKAQAAALLGIKRTALYYKLARDAASD